MRAHIEITVSCFSFHISGHYHETLSEALQGTELEFSGLQIDFKEYLFKFKYLIDRPFENEENLIIAPVQWLGWETILM